MQLELGLALQALGDTAAAWAEAQAAHDGLQALLQAAPDNADGWIIFVRIQRLLHGLAADADSRRHWRQAQAEAVARIRAAGPVQPWNERWLAPL